MRHLVTIEHKTAEAGDFDGTPEEWERLRKAWCEIEPLRGEEILQAQQLQSKVTHKVKCGEWLAGVTSEMRLTFAGRRLEITSIVNVGERNRKTEMLCIEVT